MPRKTRRNPRGMTLIELTLGLAIMSIIGLALSGFVYAVSAGWQNGQVLRGGGGDSPAGRTYASPIAQVSAVARIDSVLKSARLTGTVRRGPTQDRPIDPPAALMFWANDQAVADGKIQFSEIGLIEYDPAAKCLWWYSVVFPGNWSQGAIDGYNQGHVASDRYGYGNLVGSSSITSFKAAAHVSRQPLAKDVTACQILVRDKDADDLQAPSVDLVLDFAQGKSLSRQMVTVTLRQVDVKPYDAWKEGD